MPVKRECAVCKIPANQRCSACQAVYYCTREHQTADWKNHAKDCRPCRLVERPGQRPHYVATRDIKIGETVLVDGCPLVSAPWFTTITSAVGETPPQFSCSDCYRNSTIDRIKICRKCNVMPLCQLCTTHGAAECAFLVKHGKWPDKPHENGILKVKAHLAVKALAMRDTDPETYQKFLTLEAHCIGGNARKPNGEAGEAGEVARYVKKYCDIEHIELAEVTRIATILLARAFPIELPQSLYVAVYFKASYIDHSCRANCSKSFTADGGLIVWAAVPISKGERISINYIPDACGTMNRQTYLAENLYFNCTCELCKDPTEFGTMYSVFRCEKKNCSGFMLPSTFLRSNRKSKKTRNFTCNECCAVQTWNAIEQMERWCAITTNLIKDVDTLSGYINSFKPLHENHYLNVATETYWCLTFLMSDMTAHPIPLLKKIVDISEKIEKLYKTIEPAKNRLRGQLLFVQLQARTALCQCTYSAREVTEFVPITKKLLTEIHSLMRREPSTSPLNTAIKSHVIKELKSTKYLEDAASFLRDVFL